LNNFLTKFKIAGRNTRLFRKVITKYGSLPYPGDIKNIIKTAVAFSDASIESDYLRRLYEKFIGHIPSNLQQLQEQGFTVREIEILSGVSKSQVARALQGDK
jgi:hypothetical protein